VRIATYNVENYLTMPRRIGGSLCRKRASPSRKGMPSSGRSWKMSPDIIGLMEIGTPAQFEDLRRRLRREGVDYAESEIPRRPGPLAPRRPAEPVSHRGAPLLGDIPLRVGGVTLHSPRGFLDVTVEPVTGQRLRLLCVHLKAKREVADYDATALREAEATFLRRHVREILSRDPETRLVVMGDFNDTKNSRTVWEVSGKPDWPHSLRVLPLTDRNGESWTECWESADVYSRIDYVMVSKKLEPEIDSTRSAVARFPFWREASDHCPLALTLDEHPTTTSSMLPHPLTYLIRHPATGLPAAALLAMLTMTQGVRADWEKVTSLDAPVAISHDQAKAKTAMAARLHAQIEANESFLRQSPDDPHAWESRIRLAFAEGRLASLQADKAGVQKSVARRRNSNDPSPTKNCALRRCSAGSRSGGRISGHARHEAGERPAPWR